MFGASLPKHKVSISKVDGAEAIRDLDRAIDAREQAFARAYAAMWKSLRQNISDQLLAEIAVYESVNVTTRLFVQEAIEDGLDDLVLHLEAAAIDGAKYTGLYEEIGGATDDVPDQLQSISGVLFATQIEVFKRVAKSCRAQGVSEADAIELLRGTIGLAYPNAASLATVKAFSGIEKQLPPPVSRRVFRLLDERAHLTAEYELARAYNNAKRLQYKKALDLGLITEVEREFVSKRDAKVCGHCSPLDGKKLVARVGDSLYKSFGKAHGKNVVNPPVHMRCRCVVLFRIVSGAS